MRSLTSLVGLLPLTCRCAFRTGRAKRGQRHLLITDRISRPCVGSVRRILMCVVWVTDDVSTCPTFSVSCWKTHLVQKARGDCSLSIVAVKTHLCSPDFYQTCVQQLAAAILLLQFPLNPEATLPCTSSSRKSSSQAAGFCDQYTIATACTAYRDLWTRNRRMLALVFL